MGLADNLRQNFKEPPTKKQKLDALINNIVQGIYNDCKIATAVGKRTFSTTVCNEVFNSHQGYGASSGDIYRFPANQDKDGNILEENSYSFSPKSIEYLQSNIHAKLLKEGFNNVVVNFEPTYRRKPIGNSFWLDTQKYKVVGIQYYTLYISVSW